MADAQDTNFPQPPFYDGAVRPEDWFFLMSQFFAAERVAGDLWVARAALYLRDAALTWWRYNMVVLQAGGHVAPTWDEFGEGLREQFGPVNDAQAARMEMDALLQVAGVQVYNSSFRAVALRLPQLDTGSAVHRYLCGLDSRVGKCFSPFLRTSHWQWHRLSFTRVIYRLFIVLHG